jgi:gas vesicle protein
MTTSPKTKKAKQVLGSLVVGAAIGSITALLLAPQEGKELRAYFYKQWKKSRFRLPAKKAVTKKENS